MSTLTDDQRSKVQKWFDEKTPLIGACPMCNHREWVLGDQMVQPMPFINGGGLTIGGSAFPMIMLACGHCGNIQFQSAVMMGLLVAEAKPNAEVSEDD